MAHDPSCLSGGSHEPRLLEGGRGRKDADSFGELKEGGGEKNTRRSVLPITCQIGEIVTGEEGVFYLHRIRVQSVHRTTGKGGGMTSRAQFRVMFEGPALDTNEMDARDLAGSLFSLGDLIDSAGEIVFKGKSKASVRVKGFREGSFGVELVLDHSFLSGIAELLHGDHTPKDLLDLIGITGGSLGTVGLIQTLKFLAGKEPESIEKTDNNTFILNISVSGNHNSIAIPEVVEEMRRSPVVRKSLGKFVSTVKQEGVDKVRFTENGGNGETIEKREADYFSAPLIAENLLTDSIQRMYFTIVSISLVQGYKWRLKAGETSLQVAMKDEDFMRKVEESEENFSNGDVLECDLHTLQSVRPDGSIMTAYEITKVHDHKKSPKVQKLPLKEPE